LLAMEDNDNAGHQAPRSVLRFFASKLAPTNQRCPDLRRSAQHHGFGKAPVLTIAAMPVLYARPLWEQSLLAMAV
jgi:hypothetical protein